MMEEILINKDAINVDQLFFDQEWIIEKLYDRIYTINVSGKKLDWLIKTYDKYKYAKAENDNLSKLRGIEGVPSVLAASFKEKFNYLLLSRFEGIDLCDFIDTHGPMTERYVKKIAKQLLKIVFEMHKRGVIHKDIKPENIVYNDNTKDIYLIDFEGKNTEEYSSPEQIKNHRITEKTDTWSVGATLYFLLTGNYIPKPVVFRKKWSDELKDFLSCLLESEVVLRYSAEDALSHSWLQ